MSRRRRRRRRPEILTATFGRRAISTMRSRQGCSVRSLIAGTPQWSSTNWTSGARSASAMALSIWSGRTQRSNGRPDPARRRTFLRKISDSLTSSGTTCRTRRNPLTNGLASWRSRNAGKPSSSGRHALIAPRMRLPAQGCESIDIARLGLDVGGPRRRLPCGSRR